MGQPAIDAGIALLAGTVAQRQAGCAILGAMCVPVNNGRWNHEAGVALAAAAAVENDNDATWSIADACTEVHDPVVAPALIALARHSHRDVRFVVAGRLAIAKISAARAIRGCRGPDAADAGR